MARSKKKFTRRLRKVKWGSTITGAAAVVSLALSGYAIHQTNTTQDQQSQEAAQQSANGIELLGTTSTDGVLHVYVENTTKWPLVFADIYWAMPNKQHIAYSLEDIPQCEEIEFSEPVADYPLTLVNRSYLLYKDNEGNDWYRYMNGVANRYPRPIKRLKFVGGNETHLSGCSVN